MANNIEVEIDDETLNEATRMANEMGPLYGSITGGAGNIAGFLGELLVLRQLPTGSQHTNTRHYDITLPDNAKVDVKTKRCNGEPLPNYNASVANRNAVQKTDYYVFVRVHNKFDKAWIVGAVAKADFYDRATFMEKGERDGPFLCRADCWNLPHSELYGLDIFDKHKGDK